MSFCFKKSNALDSDDTKTEFLLALKSKRPKTVGNNLVWWVSFRTQKRANAKECSSHFRVFHEPERDFSMHFIGWKFTTFKVVTEDLENYQRNWFIVVFFSINLSKCCIILNLTKPLSKRQGQRWKRLINYWNGSWMTKYWTRDELIFDETEID